MAMPGYNMSAQPGATPALVETSDADTVTETGSAAQPATASSDTAPVDSAAPASATAEAASTAEGEIALPAAVAFVPAANPVAAFPNVPAEPAQQAPADQSGTVAAAATAEPVAAAQAAAPVPTERPAKTAAQDPDSGDTAATPQAQVIATAAEWPTGEAIEPKKKSFLSSFFGSTPASAAQPRGQDRDSRPVFNRQTKPLIEQQAAKPVIEQNDAPKPVLQIASAAPSNSKQVAMASSYGGDSSALPGVRQTALFEIKRKSGIDDDSDVDLHEDEEDGLPIRLASAAGMARLAPNGLLKQTEKVDVTCLKPSLVRVLKIIEQHYGRKIVVTSGYRSPSHNRRARGAKNSLHMYCAAADVQIEGVGKWELASYVRTMPGRGGVGTYCHTESVHVDVGPERDWNWRCRRRK